MSTAYYIKVYSTKPDQQQPEIRRFAIDISPENDVFNELQTKIASLQGETQLRDSTLQYNDEENERITFSSNEELRAAIALNKDGNTLKVFVKLNQPATSSSPPVQQQRQQSQQNEATNKECHVGVICDSCNGPVIGFRYKCFVCPDYDLCEKCSSAGVHSEHNMIKITKPGDLQHPSNPHHRGPHHYPRGPHHPHHHGHPHGRRHRHSVPFPPFVPSADFIQQVQAQIPQWLPNQENTAHLRAHMQQHLDSFKTNTQTHMQNSKQYLESVGQYLQQALSPFGIDCNYHVDVENPAAATTTTTTNTTTEEQHEEQVPTKPEQQRAEQAATSENVPTPEPSAVPKYPTLSEDNDNQQEQTASSSAPLMEVESTIIMNPIEKSIDACVEKMVAMGFIDNHGGLRELIRSKQGDLNAVLDAINPRHQ